MRVLFGTGGTFFKLSIGWCVRMERNEWNKLSLIIIFIVNIEVNLLSNVGGVLDR